MFWHMYKVLKPHHNQVKEHIYYFQRMSYIFMVSKIVFLIFSFWVFAANIEKHNWFLYVYLVSHNLAKLIFSSNSFL